jgi:hypothetical protein
VERGLGGAERRRLEGPARRCGRRPAPRASGKLGAQLARGLRPEEAIQLGVARRGKRAQDDGGERADPVSPS